MKSKPTKLVILSALFASLLFLGSGCSKKSVDTPITDADGKPVGDGTNINYPAAEGTGYSESTIQTEGSLDDTSTSTGGQTGNLSINQNGVENTEEYKIEHGRSSTGLSPIYYDFDKSGIRPDMTDRMNNNALFIRQSGGSRVVVEGNCDERGTNEYNLALGQRRAIKAKEYLINLGVEEGRIRTVSYGEERPLFIGQDEFSYSQNRRSDFIIE